MALAVLAFAAPGVEALAGGSVSGAGAQTQGGTSFIAWVVDLVGGVVDFVIEQTLP